MAKGIYLGIDSLSRKVKKMYLGVEGVARKVKKGYVGVNGLARLFFSGTAGLNKSSHVITNLTVEMWSHKSAHTGNYALVGGGSPIINRIVNAYDVDFVQQIPTEMGYPSYGSPSNYESASASSSLYAWLTTKGGTNNTPKYSVYDSSLTRTKNSEFYNGSGAGCDFTAGAMFAGGQDGGTASSLVTWYNNDLTEEKVRTLQPRSDLAGARAGDYAVFTGGDTGSNTKGTVEAYTEELVKTVLPDLPFHVWDHVGVRLGTTAVFAGGYDGKETLDTVFAYDEDLSEISCPSLPYKARYHAGDGSEELAIFAGGGDEHTLGESASAHVSFLDTDFTMHTAAEMDTERAAPNIAKCGNGFLISGGDNLQTVELYEIA